ncbi:NAD-binding protein [bacterium]|nr:NAD-binding protein [bacterium]
MKVLPALVTAFKGSRSSRLNLRFLAQIFLLLVSLIVVFSIAFHYLMEWEGQHHSWWTGFYWTIVTMSTLGYGDVTFHSDAGRVFTILVVFTGVVMLLVVFPFTFIEALYMPWVQAINESRAPRQLPRHIRGHVVLTSSDPIALALVKKLNRYNYTYALLIPDYELALRMADQGYNVMVGDLDNPATYHQAQIGIASLVATTCARDATNTNVISTVRQLSETIPVIAAAREPVAIDVMKRAGATYVMQPAEMLGKSLARRTHGGSQRAHVIAQFNELLVAEATVRSTGLAGKSLSSTRLREDTGLNVLGAWNRGAFENAGPGLKITEQTVLVLSGSQAQLDRFNAHYPQPQVSKKPVIVIGGGMVGQATGRALSEMGIDYRIVETHPTLGLDPSRLVTGDAANHDVLEQAGFFEAPTAIITTRDDDVNIYLTIYLRSLRPDILIISRSMHERNLATLHRGGADFVMSHASMAANTVFNLLKRSDIEMLAEGLDIFRLPLPAQLSGRSIADAQIRKLTGCTVVALCTPAGMRVNPDPDEPLATGIELLMIGTVENEARFLARYPAGKRG